ncbi:MAG: DinB family protein [Ferruginibacter sp.]
MKRSQLTILPEYFDRYILKCDDVELIDTIQKSIEEVQNFPVEKWKEIGNNVYAPGKWTIKDILQHMVDTERIFSYRALAFARDEMQPLPGFNEDHYAYAANAVNRPIEDIIDELLTLHHSFKQLYSSFSSETLAKTGRSFKGEYSVADIGFIIPGHQRWHLDILKERYYPLLSQQAV